jgi:hypothetical protein
VCRDRLSQAIQLQTRLVLSRRSEVCEVVSGAARHTPVAPNETQTRTFYHWYFYVQSTCSFNCDVLYPVVVSAVGSSSGATAPPVGAVRGSELVTSQLGSSRRSHPDYRCSSAGCFLGDCRCTRNKHRPSAVAGSGQHSSGASLRPSLPIQHRQKRLLRQLHVPKLQHPGPKARASNKNQCGGKDGDSRPGAAATHSL